MEKLGVLERKVNELLNQASSLKHENEKLCSKIWHIETENKRAKKILQEYELLCDEKMLIHKKISSILNKFGRLKI